MCSACDGDYENPDLTAPESLDDVLASRKNIVEASDRLRSALEELARIDAAELELLREAVRVTRLASEALRAVAPVDSER